MYRLEIARRAERGLRVIRRGDPSAYRRIIAVIRGLGSDPRPAGSEKLTAYDPPAWRVRVGDYRVVYEIDDERVTVAIVNVAPRGEVYR